MGLQSPRTENTHRQTTASGNRNQAQSKARQNSHALTAMIEAQRSQLGKQGLSQEENK